MSDKRTEVLDAAEARIRSAGYSGFSFRELASDVGVKSSSIHYYFPTKEELGVAVARRYADRFFEGLDERSPDRSPDRAQRLAAAFDKAIRGDGKVCLCGALGAASASLPPLVVSEAKSFFERALAFLLGAPQAKAASRQERDWAFQVLALLEGGTMLSLTLGDLDAFRRTTKSLPVKPSSKRP